MDKSCAVILAAGEGKRMKADMPKVMLNVLFKPMLQWVIDSVNKSGTDDICIVVGHKKEMIYDYLDNSYETVVQSEQLGTGHAVMMAKEYLEKHLDSHVLVLCGDAPFMDVETIKAAYDKHILENNSATVISAILDDPTGYGRIIRDNQIGSVCKIVEHKDATEAQRKINEINSGAYWFKVNDLLPVLNTEHLSNNNTQKEYYLPDVIKIFLDKNLNVNAFISKNTQTVMGANDRIQLNRLSEIARQNKLKEAIKCGASIPTTSGILIAPDVKLDKNVTVLPGTVIKGNTKISSGCTLGPNTFIDNCYIGKNTEINASQCKNAVIGANCSIGPFCNITDGSNIKDESCILPKS